MLPRLLSVSQRKHLCTRFLSLSKDSIRKQQQRQQHQHLLVPHHRTTILFGANTDVGKTVVSAGLVRASLLGNSFSATNTAVQYIKPLQCGGSDQAFVDKYLQQYHRPNRNILETEILFSWDAFASPHTASRIEHKPVESKDILSSLNTSLKQFAEKYTHDGAIDNSYSYIETAGGVLSPSPAWPESKEKKNPADWIWIPQADLYKPVFGGSSTQCVLVGDGRLGGISATLSALESLILRGYDVAALVFIQHPDHENAAAVREYIEYNKRHDVPIRNGVGDKVLSLSSQSVVELPPIPTDPDVPLFEWYLATERQFQQLNVYLQHLWQGQVTDFQSLATEAEDVLWRSTIHDGEAPNIVDHASENQYFFLSPTSSSSVEGPNGRDVSLGVAHPHAGSTTALATAASLSRYGSLHGIRDPVEIVHAPVVTLAQRLLQLHRPWANRVCFANDISTAMETAIQMGIKTYQTRQQQLQNVEKYDWAVCTQEDCFHGDTLGVTNVGEAYIDDQDSSSWRHPWYESKSLCLETPTLSFHHGQLSIAFPPTFQPPSDGKHPDLYTFESMEQALNVPFRRLNPRLFSHYKEVIEMQWLVYEHSGIQRIISSVVMEPLLSTGGHTGMFKLVDPLWQLALIDIAKSRGVPIIFNERTSGLYRLGRAGGHDFLASDPDICVHGNGLTGGMLPLAATLTTSEVYDACRQSMVMPNQDPLLAYPAGCLAGIHTLESLTSTFNRKRANDKRKRAETLVLFDDEAVRQLSLVGIVNECFAIGSVLAVRILSTGDDEDDAETERCIQAVLKRLERDGLHASRQRNTVFLMVSPLSAKEDCAHYLQCLHRAVEDVSHNVIC